MNDFAVTSFTTPRFNSNSHSLCELEARLAAAQLREAQGYADAIIFANRFRNMAELFFNTNVKDAGR